MRRPSPVRRVLSTALSLAALACSLSPGPAAAADCACGKAGCTGPAAPACTPECKSSWEEKKTKKPQYSLKCEHACARAAEPWHTGSPECRRRPPCGNVYVKKKLYKTEKEKVERVPKYEVQMVPADPCERCHECRVCWWNPFSILHHLLLH